MNTSKNTNNMNKNDSNEDINSKSITVRLPNTIFHTIKKNAKHLKMRQSQYVRELIQIGLNVQKAQEDSDKKDEENPFDLLYQIQRKMMKFTVENTLLARGNFNKNQLSGSEIEQFFQECDVQASEFIGKLMPNESKL